MGLTIEFSQIDRSMLPVVGGKNSSLGEMIRAGIRVPPGFALSTEAFQRFVREASIKAEIDHMMEEVNPEEMESLERTSRRIQAMFIDAPIPQEIKAAIEEGYGRLCESCGEPELPVAVRSSATAEDLPTASFAGQQDTYLWVCGADSVSRCVTRCWGSLYSGRAISYRIRHGFPHQKVLISVGVQKMVDARSAGVMFTIDPVNGDPSKVVIEGSWGLGETVVSGEVTPDKFVIDKVVMEISERRIAVKPVECLYDPQEEGVVHAKVPEERRAASCLADEELKELVAVAKRIEAHYGCAQDIEWAIDRRLSFPENIFILQSRPETVWSQRKKEPVIGRKSAYQLLMEKAMSRTKVQT